MKIQPKYMEEDRFIKKRETAMDVVDAAATSAEVNCGKEDKDKEKSSKMDNCEVEDEMSSQREVVEGTQERMKSALMSRMLEVSGQKDEEVDAMVFRLQEELGKEEDKSWLLEAEVVELTQRLESTKERCIKLEAERENALLINSELDHKLKSLEQLHQKNLELSMKLEEAEAEKVQVGNEAEDLSVRIFELESELSQSWADKSELLKERCAEHDAIHERNLELEDLVKEEEEEEDFDTRVSQLGFLMLQKTPDDDIAEARSNEVDMQQMSCRVQELESALSRFQGQEETGAECNQGLEELVRELELLLESEKSRINDLEQKCGHAEEKSAQYADMWCSLTTELDAAVQKNMGLEYQLNVIKSIYVDADRKLKQQSLEVENIKEETFCQVEKLRATIFELESALSQSLLLKSQLEAELETVNERCGEQEGRANVAQERILQLEDLVRFWESRVGESERRESEVKVVLMETPTQENRIRDVEQRFADTVSALTTEVENALEVAADNEKLLAESLESITEQKRNLEEAIPPDTMVILEVANLAHQYQELMEILKKKESEVNSLYEQQQLLVQDHQIECYEKQAAETQTCTQWQHVKELSDMCSNLEEQAKIHEINECELLESTGSQLLGLEAKFGHLETQTVDEKMSLEFRLNDLQQKLCAALADKETAAEDLKRELSSERQSFQTMVVLFMEEKHLQHDASRAAQIELQTVKTELGRVLKEYEESNGNQRAELENLKLQAAQNSILLQTRVKELEHLLLPAGIMFEKQAGNVLESPEKVQQRLEEELPSANTELGQLQGELKKSNEMKRKKRAEKSSPEGPLKNIRVAVGVGLVSIVAAILAGKK